LYFWLDSESNQRKTFGLDEVVAISTTLRDACLNFVKIVLPERRSHDYDVRCSTWISVRDKYKNFGSWPRIYGYGRFSCGYYGDRQKL